MSTSPELYRRLKETLLRCGPFDDAAALRAIFAHPSLSPWRYHVSDADDAQTRVEKLLARLAGQADARGTPALVLLLDVLAERTPGTLCAEALRGLAAAVAATPLTMPAHSSEPVAPRTDPASRRAWLPLILVLFLLLGTGGALFLFTDLFDRGGEGQGPEQLEPPHAPGIDAFGRELDGATLFDENVEIVGIEPGQRQSASVQEWWAGPIDAPASCANAFIAFTWVVREPFPGGDELEIHELVPMGGGRTELIGAGSEGKATIGMCQELIFFNPSLEPYVVEVRYISAMQ